MNNNEKQATKQMLVRILTKQDEKKRGDTDIAYRLMEQANSKGYNITKMKICDSANHQDVKIVIFEVSTKLDGKFPGCFRVHRKSQTDTYYTINALMKVKEDNPDSFSSEEEFYANHANKLLTMFNGEVIIYELITTSYYLRNGDRLEKVQ